MTLDEAVETAVFELISCHRMEFELILESVLIENGLDTGVLTVPSFSKHLDTQIKKQQKQVKE